MWRQGNGDAFQVVALQCSCALSLPPTTPSRTTALFCTLVVPVPTTEQRLRATAAVTMDDKFLTALTQALVAASQSDPPLTPEFTNAVDKVLPVFEHLGADLTNTYARFPSRSLRANSCASEGRQVCNTGSCVDAMAACRYRVGVRQIRAARKGATIFQRSAWLAYLEPAFAIW